MKKIFLILPIILLIAAGCNGSNSLPTKVGQCTNTTVSKIGTRLTDGTTGQDLMDSGSAINYTNGGYQVSYGIISGIEKSNVGDEIQFCLVDIPTGCPPGDNRGRIYRAFNRRTGDSWQASDSEHSCGGA